MPLGSNVDVPLKYRDPLTMKIMKNPVRLNNHVYERESLEKFQRKYGNTDPFTKMNVSYDIIECNELKQEIEDFIQKQNKKLINVMVKKLQGKHYNIVMYDDNTISQLKKEITLRSQIPEDELVLNFQGKILSCDFSTLKNCGITNNSVISLTLRLRGG